MFPSSLGSSMLPFIAARGAGFGLFSLRVTRFPKSNFAKSNLATLTAVHRSPQLKGRNDDGLNNRDLYKRTLERFPKLDGKETAFCYGSGAFKQVGNFDMKNNMIDYIFVIDDPRKWHTKNLELNPADYSLGCSKILGPEGIARLQEDYGARLYFNTLVPFEGGQIKYGVISKKSFLRDLLDWENLYVAGRLHKPVRFIADKDSADAISDDSELVTAQRLNLQSAVHTALLLLPETFSEEDLYLTLCGLSYTGDFRMTIGEDRNKVANIVKPNIEHFRNLYTNRLNHLKDYVHYTRGGCTQDPSTEARHHHLSQLPKNLQWYLVLEWNKDRRYRDVEDVLRAAALDRDSDDVIRVALSRIVKKTAMTQALKGIATAGIVKTTKYSWEKLKKMWKSLK